MAFGTDPAEAPGAADRKTAFYTGTAKPGAGADQNGRVAWRGPGFRARVKNIPSCQLRNGAGWSY